MLPSDGDALRVAGPFAGIGGIELPRRPRDGEEGCDALAIVLVNCRSGGLPATITPTAPAPQRGDVDHHEMTVHRLAQLYEQKYRTISL